MANSKVFGVPGASGVERAIAQVNVTPETGNPRLSRTPADIMCGFVPGLSGVAVNAFRASMPNGVESPIEAISRSLVMSAAGLPMTIRSTSALDVGQNVIIRSIGANFLPAPNQVVTLNGLTPVPLNAGNPLTRINLLARMSGDFAGNILVENAGTIYAFIEAGEQSMRSSIYSVPAGFRFFLADVMSSFANDTGAGVSCAMVLGIKPALSNGYGSLTSWTLFKDGGVPSHFQQQYSQGLTGPLDFCMFGTASAANMNIQTLMSGVLQDLSVTL